MEITLYASKRTTAEGKTFYNYLSRLTRKDGTELLVRVKFREDAGHPRPEQCPMNIAFPKTAANLNCRHFPDKVTGEVKDTYTLWVSEWKPGAPYVDHSMDDFE